MINLRAATLFPSSPLLDSSSRDSSTIIESSSCCNVNKAITLDCSAALVCASTSEKKSKSLFFLISECMRHVSFLSRIFILIKKKSWNCLCNLNYVRNIIEHTSSLTRDCFFSVSSAVKWNKFKFVCLSCTLEIPSLHLTRSWTFLWISWEMFDQPWRRKALGELNLKELKNIWKMS